MKVHGTVIWFTGLSGSGKTTIATRLMEELKKRNTTVVLFDGDRERAAKKLHSFNKEDIYANNREIIGKAMQFTHSYQFVLISVIMPFRKIRTEARNAFGKQYIEIFVDTPLSVCKQRDVKGLYKKALSGELKQFIGIDPSVPYERPVRPDIILPVKSIDQQVAICIQYLERNHYL